LFAPGIEIVVDPPKVTPPLQPGGAFRVDVCLRQGDATEAVYFKFSRSAAVPSPLGVEALLPLVLIPAMKLGCPVRLEGPVCRQLLDGARRFQEIFSTWYPEYQPVPIRAEPVERTAPEPDPRGVGVFFSGGLDSSYSLVKHCGELTHAVFVHGCDIPLENTAYCEKTLGRLRETAASFGVALVEVETDLLRFSDPLCHWGYHYHGAALASIAMMLSGSLRKVFIASSTSYVRIVPWGSSLVTDPLWTTPLLGVVYDGAEMERLGKIEAVAKYPVVLRNLRVCFETPEDGYNCGRCEKCYRTMVGLRVAGALARCDAFDRPLDLDAMLEHPEVLKKFTELRSWSVSREVARARGTDHELIRALDEVHRRSAFVDLVQRMCRDKKDIVRSPGWRASLPKFRTALFDSLREEDPEWFAGKVLSWLPAERDRAFNRLADHDRPWFKKSVLRHRWRRLLEKLRWRRRPPASGG
jgi:hypothetical protein